MKTISQIIKNKEIRNKILFTLICIAIFRIGATIPLPVLKVDAMKEMLEMNAFFSMYEMFSGGTFAQLSLFTLGITPYITASIVINLLTYVLPTLEELSQEGEMGRKKIKKYTVQLGLLIATIQGIGFTEVYFKPYLINNSLALKAITVGVLVFGVYLLTIIDTKIEKHGIGRGASVIICASILSKLPQSFYSIGSLVKSNEINITSLTCVAIGLFLLIALVIQVQEATRKVKINYAKHSAIEEVRSERSYLPLKLNQSSITPVIFAQTLLTFPQMIAMLIPNDTTNKVVEVIQSNVIVFNVLLAVLIIFFNYFYTTLAFDTDKIAENLKKAHGFIDEVRPGKDTANYLRDIMNKLMIIGNMFLIFVALIPTAVNSVIPVGMALMGTSLLIVTSTSMDIIKQIKAQISSGQDRLFFNI